MIFVKETPAQQHVRPTSTSAVLEDSRRSVADHHDATAPRRTGAGRRRRSDSGRTPYRRRIESPAKGDVATIRRPRCGRRRGVGSQNCVNAGQSRICASAITDDPSGKRRRTGHSRVPVMCGATYRGAVGGCPCFDDGVDRRPIISPAPLSRSATHRASHVRHFSTDPWLRRDRRAWR